MVADGPVESLLRDPERTHAAWEAEGVLVIRGLFAPALVTALMPITERVFTQWRACDVQTGKPGVVDAKAMRHLNHPSYHRGHPDDLRAILETIAHADVLRLLRVLYGEEPLFRTTSLFFSPDRDNRQGHWHRDTQFGAEDDAADRRRFEEARAQGYTGIQLQIPLLPSEDIEYVPGSHLRYDTPGEFAIRRADGGSHCTEDGMPGALRPSLAAGDGIVFNPYGLHRGRYFADRRRRTYMLTYTRTSHPVTDYFSDQPWFLEAGYLDGCTEPTRRLGEAFIATYRDAWLASTRG